MKERNLPMNSYQRQTGLIERANLARSVGAIWLPMADAQLACALSAIFVPVQTEYSALNAYSHDKPCMAIHAMAPAQEIGIWWRSVRGSSQFGQKYLMLTHVEEMESKRLER